MKHSKIGGLLAVCLLVIAPAAMTHPTRSPTNPSRRPLAPSPKRSRPMTTDDADDEMLVETTEPRRMSRRSSWLPSAIISLSPTATEMLYAIGAGDQVLAVDDFSNYPPEAADKMQGISGVRAERRGDRRARARPHRDRRHQSRLPRPTRHARDRPLGGLRGRVVRRRLRPDRAARRWRPGTSPRRPSWSARCRPTSPP